MKLIEMLTEIHILLACSAASHTRQ